MGRYRPPSWEWPVAGVAHLFLFSLVALAQCGSRAEPLFKPEDAIIVEMSGPPAAQSRMPQKAERAPDAPRGAPSPDAVKPPPNPSELALPNAEKTKGSESADTQREDLMAEIRKQQLLRDLSAPEGTTDRLATGDSSGDGLTAQAGVHDPELAKWVKAANAALAKNFHPLPAWCAANPAMKANAAAMVAGDGTISEEGVVVTSSKNPSFDAACVRALAVTAHLPPPPPKFSAGVRGVLECTCN